MAFNFPAEKNLNFTSTCACCHNRNTFIFHPTVFALTQDTTSIQITPSSTPTSYLRAHLGFTLALVLLPFSKYLYGHINKKTPTNWAAFSL